MRPKPVVGTSSPKPTVRETEIDSHRGSERDTEREGDRQTDRQKERDRMNESYLISEVVVACHSKGTKNAHESEYIRMDAALNPKFTWDSRRFDCTQRSQHLHGV